MSPQTKSNLASAYGGVLLGIVIGCFACALLLPSDKPRDLRPEDMVEPTLTDDYFETVDYLLSDCRNITRNSDVFDNDDRYFRECQIILNRQTQ